MTASEEIAVLFGLTTLLVSAYGIWSTGQTRTERRRTEAAQAERDEARLERDDARAGLQQQLRFEPEITITVGSSNNVAVITVSSTGADGAIVKDVTTTAVRVSDGEVILSGRNLDVLEPGGSSNFGIPLPHSTDKLTAAEQTKAFDDYNYRVEYTLRGSGQRLRKERQGMLGSVTGPIKI